MNTTADGNGVDGSVIDCPPTPEHASLCPTTPPPNVNTRIREFLKLHLMGGSDSGGEDATTNEDCGDGGGDETLQREQQTCGSPPPNCAICLGKISSKCFTDSCMHQFCFSCLLEWSKIKAECPLCKQTFKSIIHNVTSMDKYEEYKVEHRRCSNWSSIANQFEQILFDHSVPRLLYNHRRFANGSSVTNQLPVGPAPSYNSSSVSENTSNGVTTHNYRIYQLFLHVSPLTERFAREYADDTIPSRTSGTIWRSYIYQRRLYAMPLLDPSGRTRDISARFYRENPAQVHRLMAWLNREVLWILNSYAQVNYVMGMIEAFIVRHDMTSRNFRNRLQSYFHRFTNHFIHELTNFARSHYDMIGYDRNVQYRPYYEEDIESIDSDDSMSSIETVPFAPVIVQNNWLHQNAQLIDSAVNAAGSNSGDGMTRVGENAAYLLPSTRTLDLMTPTGPLWYSMLNGGNNTNVMEINENTLTPSTTTDQSSSSGNGDGTTTATVPPPSAIIAASTSAAGGQSTVEGVPQPSSSSSSSAQQSHVSNCPLFSQSNRTPELVNLDDTDSDECVYVSEQKPPHLRTPVMVELNSESDSDVQFITEEVPIKLEGDPNCIHPSTQQQQPQQHQHQATNSTTSQRTSSRQTDGGELASTAVNWQTNRNSSSDELHDLLIQPNVTITITKRRKRKHNRRTRSVLSSSSSTSDDGNDVNDQTDADWQIKRYKISHRRYQQRPTATITSAAAAAAAATATTAAIPTTVASSSSSTTMPSISNNNCVYEGFNLPASSVIKLGTDRFKADQQMPDQHQQQSNEPLNLPPCSSNDSNIALIQTTPQPTVIKKNYARPIRRSSSKPNNKKRHTVFDRPSTSPSLPSPTLQSTASSATSSSPTSSAASSSSSTSSSSSSSSTSSPSSSSSASSPSSSSSSNEDETEKIVSGGSTATVANVENNNQSNKNKISPQSVLRQDTSEEENDDDLELSGESSHEEFSLKHLSARPMLIASMRNAQKKKQRPQRKTRKPSKKQIADEKLLLQIEKCKKDMQKRNVQKSRKIKRKSNRKLQQSTNATTTTTTATIAPTASTSTSKEKPKTKKLFLCHGGGGGESSDDDDDSSSL